MKMCKNKDVIYSISENIIYRSDLKYHFVSKFNMKTGAYIRSGVLKDGKDSGEDPFMASYPHLIDVGIMGHCIHGETGLCEKAGIGCYQSGKTKKEPNMSLENFKKIADESSGLVDQFALGGRGDPDCHENFEEILSYCREKNIVPNYTTSGFTFNAYKAELSKKYCGAVAVSWYRSKYTYRALELLISSGVKTNIHYVLGNNSIDEAIERLNNDDFPDGLNAIIFLLHKPVGQGSSANVLSINDKRLQVFFDVALKKKHPFKIGFDACSVPAILNFSNNVDANSIDTCEGGRFSMYIGSDMLAYPCSFDAKKKYAYEMSNATILDAWNSKQFEDYRNVMRKSCPACEKKYYCLGGCPLTPEIVLCKEKEKFKFD